MHAFPLWRLWPGFLLYGPAVGEYAPELVEFGVVRAESAGEVIAFVPDADVYVGH